jgi:hypothetical protein
MAMVFINEYLEEADVSINVEIDLNEDAGLLYELTFLESSQWLSEKDINLIIKLLQKAKRIHKTRIIKEND